MSFEVIDSLFTIKADGIMTVAMAAVILLIGFFIKSKVKFLEKYCIPAPVVGGFLFMFVTFIGHVTGTFAFSFDSMYQSPFMLAFFTTVGLGASISLLKKGGMLLIVYWLIAGIISAFQNVIWHRCRQAGWIGGSLCIALQRYFHGRWSWCSGCLWQYIRGYGIYSSTSGRSGSSNVWINQCCYGRWSGWAALNCKIQFKTGCI